jgi:hypothetical protein
MHLISTGTRLHEKSYCCFIAVFRRSNKLALLHFTKFLIHCQLIVPPFNAILSFVCMYVWEVGQKIRPLHRDLQLSIVLPLLISPLLIPHLEWSVGLCLRGLHSSHLVPWKTGPGDEILNKLWSHNHRICVADSSSSRHLLQMASSVNFSSKRCPFT